MYLYHDLPLVPHTSQYALRNNHSLVQFSAHTNCFYYSFFPYVTSLWNTLPDSITSAPSIYTFQNLVHLVYSWYGHVLVLVFFTIHYVLCICIKFYREKKKYNVLFQNPVFNSHVITSTSVISTCVQPKFPSFQGIPNTFKLPKN